jgi:hypothetical protein
MGKLVEIKTKKTAESVEDFINNVNGEQKRKDSFAILELMKSVSKEQPKMWGSSIIGFGNVQYKSPSTGKEVNWMKIGFSPRKANISLYLTNDVNDYATLLPKLGKHKTGVGCLYINKLIDIDIEVLKAIIEESLNRK